MPFLTVGLPGRCWTSVYAPGEMLLENFLISGPPTNLELLIEIVKDVRPKAGNTIASFLTDSIYPPHTTDAIFMAVFAASWISNGP